MRARRLLLIPIALAVGALVLPVTSSAYETGVGRPRPASSFIAVNSRGTAKNTSTIASRTVYTFDLYSLATNEKIGTVTDDVFCSTLRPPPCAVFDALTTFHLPDGDLVNHANVSVVPDSQKPGWFSVAEGDGGGEGGIIGEKSTGVYKDRTGVARLRGSDDGSKYPAELTADDFWVIQLDS